MSAIHTGNPWGCGITLRHPWQSCFFSKCVKIKLLILKNSHSRTFTEIEWNWCKLCLSWWDRHLSQASRLHLQNHSNRCQTIFCFGNHLISPCNPLISWSECKIWWSVFTGFYWIVTRFDRFLLRLMKCYRVLLCFPRDFLDSSQFNGCNSVLQGLICFFSGSNSLCMGNLSLLVLIKTNIFVNIQL